MWLQCMYLIAGKFGEFGKSFITNNLLTNLFIHQTFFYQIFEKSKPFHIILSCYQGWILKL